MAIDKKTPTDRLKYSGSLDVVVDRFCGVYGVGKFIKFSIIEVGFEDCNVLVETDTGRYVAKIFSKVRTQEDIARYSTIMDRATKAGVNHPTLHKTPEGEVVYVDHKANGLSLVLMDFIEGKSFLQLDRVPSRSELRKTVEQAAKINKIDHHPPYLFDSWAIPNIQTMFGRVRQFIQPEDLGLVERAIQQYAEIPVDGLPHCFVHGDFTKANVMKGDDMKIYILDFSVSNWYPRIQELAVIAANLLHDKAGSTHLKEETELVADEYNKFNPLTEEERKWLYPYTLAGVAMEFMGAHQEKYINGNDTEEADYWLELGRRGLRRELQTKP